MLTFRCDECGRKQVRLRRANPGAARPLCPDCYRAGVTCDVCGERRPPDQLAPYYSGEEQEKRCLRCTRTCRACRQRKSVRRFPGKQEVDLCEDCFGRCRYCRKEAPRQEMALGFDPKGTACRACVRTCQKCRRERPRVEAFRTVEGTGVDLEVCDPCLADLFSPPLRPCLERIFAWAVLPADTGVPDPLSGLGDDLLVGVDDRGRPVTLPAEARPGHVLVLGEPSGGKLELLRNLAVQDIRRGAGVCVIDRHGGICGDLLELVPPSRAGEVVHVRPGEPECPPYNLFATPHDPNTIARDVVAALKHFVGHEWDPRMDSLVNYAVVTLLADRDHEPHPFADLWRIFVDAEFRNAVVARCRDSWLRNFWLREYPRFPHDAALPFLQRLAWVLRPAPGSDRLFRAPVNALDIDGIVERGEVLLCDLSRSQLGAEPSQIAAALLAIGLAHACALRDGIGVRPPFFAYLDEFTDYASGSLASVLAGAQGSRLQVTVASDRVDPGGVLARVQSAASAFVCTPVHPEDAPAAARMLASRVYAGPDGDILLLPDLVAERARAWVGAVAAMLRIPGRHLPAAIDAQRYPEVVEALQRADGDLVSAGSDDAPAYCETARVLEALQAFAYQPREHLRVPREFTESVWPDEPTLRDAPPGTGILKLRDPASIERFALIPVPDQARSPSTAERIRSLQRERAARESASWMLPAGEEDEADPG